MGPSAPPTGAAGGRGLQDRPALVSSWRGVPLGDGNFGAGVGVIEPGLLSVGGGDEVLDVSFLQFSLFALEIGEVGVCHAQDAILSLFWHEGLNRDRSASRHFARMDIITSTCKEEMSIWNWLTLATSYIKITSIQQHIQSSYTRAGSDYGRNQMIK